MSVYIGIDPGVGGAIGMIGDQYRPDVLVVMDMPTLTILVGAKKRPRQIIDASRVAAIFRDLKSNYNGELRVAIEKVNAAPNKKKWKGNPLLNGNAVLEEQQAMSPLAMLSYGTGYGIFLGVFAALEIPVTEVHPATWKARMCESMQKGKDASRLRAAQLFGSKVDLSKKKHHGRADALLIAEYGRRLG